MCWRAAERGGGGTIREVQGARKVCRFKKSGLSTWLRMDVSSLTVSLCLKGSRQQHKWVMEYDTYEFTSKTWKCKEIFFCKIDTWLAGVCDPAHPELWKTGSRAPAASAKSIFYDYGDRDSKASHQSCGHAQEMASTVSMNDTGCSSGDGCNPEAVKDLSTSSHEATVQGQLGSLDELFELHEGIASEAESSDDEPSEAAEAEMAAQELVQAVAERAGGCLVIV